MSSGRKKLDKNVANQGMEAIQEYARGQKPFPELVDEVSNLQFSDLQILMRAADEAAAKKPNNYYLRGKAVYAYAIWRDMVYLNARGRFHTGLGIHSAFRSLYEPIRANVEWQPREESA